MYVCVYVGTDCVQKGGTYINVYLSICGQETYLMETRQVYRLTSDTWGGRWAKCSLP